MKHSLESGNGTVQTSSSDAIGCSVGTKVHQVICVRNGRRSELINTTTNEVSKHNLSTIGNGLDKRTEEKFSNGERGAASEGGQGLSRGSNGVVNLGVGSGDGSDEAVGSGMGGIGGYLAVEGVDDLLVVNHGLLSAVNDVGAGLSHSSRDKESSEKSRVGNHFWKIVILLMSVKELVFKESKKVG